MFKRSDLWLGGMLFSFFMGAGNIIFPPSVGLQAGEAVLPAGLGFLVTAVGLPLLGFLAVVRQGSFEDLFKHTPIWVGAVIIFACYMALGPGFAVPRTSVVSYEILIKPLLGQTSSSLWLYSLAYFALALWLSWSPRKLVDRLGKVIAPVLIFLMLVIAVFVGVQPYASLELPQAAYQQQPFLQGVLQGYQTMDALAALIFGAVMLGGLRARDGASHALTKPALLAGFGLSCVYICLTYLGATAGDLVPQGSHGADILTQYTLWLFGAYGHFLFGGVLLLACLTSAIGLMVACAHYLHRLAPHVSYAVWLSLITGFSWLMTNLGLDGIIQFSLPVLALLYPLAMVVILFSFCGDHCLCPRFTLCSTLGVTFVFSCFDVLYSLDALPSLYCSILRYLPLYDRGLAWLLPTVTTLLGCQAWAWFVNTMRLTGPDQAK